MSTGLWRAPLATGPVDAVAALPGSKSITARALVLGALADGPSVIRQPLHARDTDLMVAGLRALGVGIEPLPPERDGDVPGWEILPGALRGARVDCGLSGTVMRFLAAVAPLALGTTTLAGDPYASERPMAPLLDVLRALGVSVEGTQLPVTIDGQGRLPGGTVTIDSSRSSQFLSALLLAAPRADAPLTIRHEGSTLPSRPHIEMTVEMVRARGVTVAKPDPDTWRVEPGSIAPVDIDVEPDLSNAAPFVAAALVTGGRVRITHWPHATTQPGAWLQEFASLAGGTTTLDDGGLTVTGGPTVAGFDVDLRDHSELLPVLAAVATVASGPSRIRGVAHVRGHETDRLAALATELGKLGADVTETTDGLTITPRPLRGTVLATYDDHRMVTAAAVLGLVVDHVEVENLGATTKTLPQFAALWRTMLTSPASPRP